MTARRNEWIIDGAVRQLLDVAVAQDEAQVDYDRGFEHGVKALAKLLLAEM